jgi:hypothetical protein
MMWCCAYGGCKKITIDAVYDNAQGAAPQITCAFYVEKAVQRKSAFKN